MSPKTKPSAPIAIYTRTSNQGDRSAEEMLTHDLQRDQCEAYLCGKGFEIAEERFEDTDQSGGKMSRPAFDRLIAGIMDGTYGGICIAYLDRFARAREADVLISKIEAKDAAFIALDFDVNTTTAMGRAMLAFGLAFAALVREQAVEKQATLAAFKLAQDGGKGNLGGRAAVGYEFEVVGQDENGKDLLGWLIPSPDAPIICEAFEGYDSGRFPTTGKVADFLNSAGVTTTRGTTWNAQTARDLLQRKVYIGVRTYGDKEFPGAHVGIVPADVFRRIQVNHFSSAKKPRNVGEGFSLGGGLVHCSVCDKSLSRGLANGKTELLRCDGRGGGHAIMTYRLAEEFIVAKAFSHGGAVVAGDNRPDTAEAEALLDRRLAELADAVALRDTGMLSPATAARMMSDAEKARDDAQNALDRLAPTGDLTLIFGSGRVAEWETLGVAEKRQALHAIIRKVTMYPAKAPRDAQEFGGVKRTKAEKVGARMLIEFQDGTTWPSDPENKLGRQIAEELAA